MLVAPFISILISAPNTHMEMLVQIPLRVCQVELGVLRWCHDLEVSEI